MTNLYADNVITSVNWAISDTEIIERLEDGDPRDVPTDWIIADDLDEDVELICSIENPPEDLVGEQTFVIRVRSSDNEVGDPAAATFELREGSTLIQTFEDNTVVTQNQDGETWIGTFDANDISDETAIEFRLLGDSTGGMPGTRDTVEIGAFRFEATLPEPFVTVTTNGATNITDDSATLNGTVDWFDSQVEVWFEWGEVGSGFPNQTTKQTITDTGEHTFDDAITTLSSGIEYEFRAHADRDSGTEVDQGTVNTFETLISISGVVKDESDTLLEGAKVYVSIIDGNNNVTLQDVVSTNASGEFDALVDPLSENETIHVSGQYEENGIIYAGESKPFIE